MPTNGGSDDFLRGAKTTVVVPASLPAFKTTQKGNGAHLPPVPPAPTGAAAAGACAPATAPAATVPVPMVVLRASLGIGVVRAANVLPASVAAAAVADRAGVLAPVPGARAIGVVAPVPIAVAPLVPAHRLIVTVLGVPLPFEP